MDGDNAINNDRLRGATMEVMTATMMEATMMAARIARCWYWGSRCTITEGSEIGVLDQWPYSTLEDILPCLLALSVYYSKLRFCNWWHHHDHHLLILISIHSEGNEYAKEDCMCKKRNFPKCSAAKSLIMQISNVIIILRISWEITINMVVRDSDHEEKLRHSSELADITLQKLSWLAFPFEPKIQLMSIPESFAVWPSVTVLVIIISPVMIVILMVKR